MSLDVAIIVTDISRLFKKAWSRAGNGCYFQFCFMFSAQCKKLVKLHFWRENIQTIWRRWKRCQKRVDWEKINGKGHRRPRDENEKGTTAAPDSQKTSHLSYFLFGSKSCFFVVFAAPRRIVEWLMFPSCECARFFVHNQSTNFGGKNGVDLGVPQHHTSKRTLVSWSSIYFLLFSMWKPAYISSICSRACFRDFLGIKMDILLLLLFVPFKGRMDFVASFPTSFIFKGGSKTSAWYQVISFCLPSGKV